MNKTNPFIFKSYSFSPKTLTAKFSYQGPDQTNYTEKIVFARPNHSSNLKHLSLISSSPHPKNNHIHSKPLQEDTLKLQALLNQALFLSFILIGTSYFKAHPTPHIQLDFPLDAFQANFFTTVYTHGLSQFIYENKLPLSLLPNFKSTKNPPRITPLTYDGEGILSLQSGGKDSLLTAKLLQNRQKPYFAWYLSGNKTYPAILKHLPGNPPLLLAQRHLDLKNLKKASGFSGHIPITYINQSLALIQALISGQNIILTSIGQEGDEPHTYLENLPINHQWSKTYFAEQLFQTYVKRYLSPDIHIGSPLRSLTEYQIAKLFTKHCWAEYKTQFSSCNLANYRQKTPLHIQTNSNLSKKLTSIDLSWCGQCPKCANTYLLFAPHLPAKELRSIFNHQDLFENPTLQDTFKGLLGLDHHQKPFECIAEIDELRLAYHNKSKDYSNLPFMVPKSNFQILRSHPHNEFLKKLLFSAES